MKLRIGQKVKLKAMPREIFYSFAINKDKNYEAYLNWNKNYFGKEGIVYSLKKSLDNNGDVVIKLLNTYSNIRYFLKEEIQTIDFKTKIKFIKDLIK